MRVFTILYVLNFYPKKIFTYIKSCIMHKQQRNSLELPRIKKIQQYIFKYSDKIGQGQFSQAYKAIDQKHQATVAIKVIHLASLNSTISKSLLQNEIAILKHLDHPNIIKCHDVITSINNCYIVSQFCENGDLEKHVYSRKGLPQNQIQKLVYDIYKGLLYLSERNIVHRDLKLANIFLTNNTAKISDFGFAVVAKNFFKDISIGSPVYMSPQALISQVYGPKTDVWSFGLLIYQMIHGEVPLGKCKTQEQLKDLCIIPPSISPFISKQLRQLIKVCLTVNPQNRPTIKDLLNTPYMQKIFVNLGDIQIQKKLTNTTHSSSTTISHSASQPIFKWVLNYDEALSLVHYCRLIYKVSQNIQSRILISWLLIINQSIYAAQLTNDNQTNKLKEVISQYHQKYLKQFFNFPKTEITISQIMQQCKKLKKAGPMKNHLNILINETKNLKKSIQNNSMEYFCKHTQIEVYLTKKNQQK